MARVNRTTGTLLILGVAVLLATVTGTRLFINPAKLPTGPEPAEPQANQPDIFAGGRIDAPGGLSAPVPGVPGRVAAIMIKEDQIVKQNEVILQLDDTAERKKLESAEKALDAAAAKLKAAPEVLKEHKLKLIEKEHQVEVARNALELEKILYAEAEKRYNQKIAATAEVEFQTARKRRQIAEETVVAAERALSEFKSIDPRLALKEHEENYKKAEKDVEAAKAAIEMYKVKAPFNGRVIALNIRPGEQFGAAMFPGAQPPIVFAPEGDLIARAEVDQDNAWKVKPGMKVTLKDKSPSRHHEWTGVVERVSPWLQRQRGTAFEPDQMNDTRTRGCIIRINPDPDNPLIIGQQMRVRIHVDSK